MTFSRTCTAAAALLALLATGQSQAQTMKAGLWEVNSKIGGSAEMDQAMARMREQIAGMPPAQRKAMEDSMAKQGITMSGAGSDGMVVKSCVTQEMADRSQMPVQQQGNCTTNITDKSKTGMKMTFTCANPASTGEGQFTFAGDTAYTMKMKVNSVRQGKPQVTNIDAAGKWLGKDCGTIKPMK